MLANRLENGVQRYKDDNAIGCVADIASLPSEIKEVADLVVSTFTLLYIPPNQRIRIVHDLVNLNCCDGDIFIEIPVSEELNEVIKLIKDQYKTSKIIYFNSPLSRIYARVIKYIGIENLNLISRAFTKLATFICERCYPNMVFGNKEVLLMGYGKKNVLLPPHKNHFLNFEKVSRRVFRYKSCPTLSKIMYEDNIEELVVALQQRLTSDEYKVSSLLFIQPFSTEKNDDFTYLFQWLEDQNRVFKVQRFIDHPKCHDVVIYLNYSGPDTYYFHYQLMSLARQSVIITFGQSMEKRIEMMF